MSSYIRLEEALAEAIATLRDFLGALDNPPNGLEFNIEADGRVMEGEIKVVFRLSDYCGSSHVTTKGGDLTNVVEEFARRYGWTQANDALYLPKVNGNERTSQD